MLSVSAHAPVPTRCEFPQCRFSDAWTWSNPPRAFLFSASPPDHGAAPPLRFCVRFWHGCIVFARDMSHIGSPIQCGSTQSPCKRPECGSTECWFFLEDKWPAVYRYRPRTHRHCTAPCADQDAWVLRAPSRSVRLHLKSSPSRSRRRRTSSGVLSHGIPVLV